MALVLPTHAVTIKSAAPIDRGAVGYDTPDPGPTTKATGVPAAITTFTGQTSNQLDAQTDLWLLTVDAGTDLTRFDLVIDEATGDSYRVENVVTRVPTGELAELSYTRATLRLTQA